MGADVEVDDHCSVTYSQCDIFNTRALSCAECNFGRYGSSKRTYSAVDGIRTLAFPDAANVI
jgi:hypothetical protein